MATFRPVTTLHKSILELARRYDCKLQMGGSDQWGNIVNGVELGRRVDQRTLYGLTTPLITTASVRRLGLRIGKPARREVEGRDCFGIGQTGTARVLPSGDQANSALRLVERNRECFDATSSNSRESMLSRPMAKVLPSGEKLSVRIIPGILT